jgi:uncharacterized protein YecT (DUF1311 family)
MKFLALLFLVLSIPAFSLPIEESVDCTNEEDRNSSYYIYLDCAKEESDNKFKAVSKEYKILISDFSAGIKSGKYKGSFDVNIEDGPINIKKSQELWKELVKVECQLTSMGLTSAGNTTAEANLYDCLSEQYDLRLISLRSYREHWLIEF